MKERTERRASIKIEKIIRERRLAKGLTQEQIASQLGVTASAVNKWEKGISHPDITLLPPLARLLNTDLNTLLSFREDLSDREIGEFLNRLSDVAKKDGVKEAFRMAEDKIREFPHCSRLILSAAITLDGLAAMSLDEVENFAERIESLYLRATESEELPVQAQAKSMLFSKLIGKKKFEEAEQLLQEIPDDTGFDKQQLLITLYCSRKEWEKAAQLVESKILSYAGKLQSSLYKAMEIAFQQSRVSDAEKIARKVRKMTALFDLWKGSALAGEFQLALLQEDNLRCRRLLQEMLPAMDTEWNPEESPLYRHLPRKENRDNFIDWLIPKMISDLKDSTSDEYNFLREDPDMLQQIEDYRKKRKAR